jgi:hypothetical protein
MVSPFKSALLGGPVAEAWRGSNFPHSDAAWALESSCASGTLTTSGSAL